MLFGQPGVTMESHEDKTIRDRLKSVARSAQPPTERERRWAQIVRRAGRRRWRRRAFYAAFGIVLVGAVAWGASELYQTVGEGATVLILDVATTASDQTAGTSTTVTISAGAAATENPTLYLTESSVQGAKEVANDYLMCVQTDNLAGFSKLIDLAVNADPSALLEEERANLQAAGDEAFVVNSMKPWIWTGNGYLLESSVQIPDDIDVWIREDPYTRTALEILAMDGSLRFLRAEYRSASDEWLVVP